LGWTLVSAWNTVSPTWWTTESHRFQYASASTAGNGRKYRNRKVKLLRRR
jgi:hypothetical protein